MKQVRLFIAAVFIMVVGVFALTPAITVGAQGYDPLGEVCSDVNDADTTVCQKKDDDAGDLIGVIINTLLFIIGALSVIMIIVAGIMYATSGGSSGAVSKAKNMLTYSIIGLVVAFLSYAIVNWVLRLF